GRSHDGRIVRRQAHFLAHSGVVRLHPLSGDEFKPSIMPGGLARLVIDQMAHGVGLTAIPCRGTERAMWHNQINDDETPTAANERVLQASESFPACRGLLPQLGRMILH